MPTDTKIYSDKWPIVIYSPLLGGAYDVGTVGGDGDMRWVIAYYSDGAAVPACAIE